MIAETHAESLTLPGYMGLATLAKYLDLCEDTVEEWVRLGLLPPPIKKRGKRLWKRVTVEQYLDAEGNPGAPSASNDDVQRVRENTRAAITGRH